jgi:hypothetical protein
LRQCKPSLYSSAVVGSRMRHAGRKTGTR